MRRPHTSTYRGRKVFVRLKNGTTWIDRFVEKTGKFVVLKDHGKILTSSIAAFSDYRVPPHEQQTR